MDKPHSILENHLQVDAMQISVNDMYIYYIYIRILIYLYIYILRYNTAGLRRIPSATAIAGKGPVDPNAHVMSQTVGFPKLPRSLVSFLGVQQC